MQGARDQLPEGRRFAYHKPGRSQLVAGVQGGRGGPDAGRPGSVADIPAPAREHAARCRGEDVQAAEEVFNAALRQDAEEEKEEGRHDGLGVSDLRQCR